MDKEIKRLKEQFRNAKTEKELEEIDWQMSKLSEEKELFAETMLNSIRETNAEVEDTLLREKLEDILPVISVSHLAKTYFQKTPQWFYQRLNRNTVNGKMANFTKEELKTLANALSDISDKIQKTVALVV